MYKFYHVILGDFNIFDDYVKNEDLLGAVFIKFLFILTTFVMVIVMLNLFIAFVCDSYNKTITKKSSAYIY